MENLCNVNHLDADDVLLPPRKRLLAGLKKQNLDRDNVPGLSLSGSSSVTPFGNTSSFPAFSSGDFSGRLGELVISGRSSSNLTLEEIIEASKFEAVSAMKAAETARAAAEEKAAIAAKAIVAAKSALDLVASFSEEAPKKEKKLKNKLKKHLPVQLLYKKYQLMENCRTDEEFARKLHRLINSSHRISKNCSTSDSRKHKHRKPNGSTSYEMAGIACSGAVFQQDHLSRNHHAAVSKADSEESIKKSCSSEEERTTNKYDKSSQMEVDYQEAESNSPKENFEDMSSIGNKKGRVRLKQLSLSICTTKDKAITKGEIQCASTPSTEADTGNPLTTCLHLFPMEPSADGLMPTEVISTM